MGVYIAVVILIFYFVLAWFAGSILHLQGASLWILRGGLVLIGLVAAGFFFWFHRRLQRRQAGIVSPSAAGPEEIGVLLKHADQKLRKSKQRSLRSFPVVFVIGEPNSAKTSTVLGAGLEPELLAGHVFRDSDVVSTSTINVWLARDTIFIESAGKLVVNQQMWMALLRQTMPGRFSAAMGRGHQAPRAVLVCLGCDRLGAAHAVAQNLGSRLKEMAQSLGAAFPVYVLFTKLDLLPCFTEFVANFTSDESTQILGATLPRVHIEGVFAEEESKRLAKAFDQIVYSLAEKRLDHLGREALPEKRPAIYEFSRELGKVRNQAIQCLVEMARPTQLNVNPFLRGFYFSGVRPVVINEAVSLAGNAPPPQVGGSGATRMFSLQDKAALAQAAPVHSVRSRRVPEWTFLPHLFTDVVLRDRVAFSSSHQSRRVDTLRAVLLVCAALIFLFFAGALVVSFFNNRALQGAVEQAARGLGDSPQTPDFPGVERLRQLDQLRATVADLARYKADGAPLSYRFGLYAGDSIYPSARSLYFTQFKRMLLDRTQARLVARLKKLPDTASPSDEFGEPYNSLKAYLMTTDFPAKSSQDFLSPVLLDRWLDGQALDFERAKLARTQFDFYSSELPRGLPIVSSADAEAVKRARGYLTSGGFENVYRRILFAVAGNRQPINFNRMYPGSAAQVINGYEVPAAFTKESFKAMQEVIRNPEKFFQGEDWVLGDAANSGLSVSSLRQQLPVRYTNDYLNHWRKFIKATTVVRYGSLPDAAIKLQGLSGNTSFLLQLFTLAGQHTSVESPEIANEFQPLQLVAGKPEQLISAANQPYVQGLQQLQQGVSVLASAPPADLTASSAVTTAAGTAKGAVNQVLAQARIDNETQAPVKTLMLAPIISAEGLALNRVPGSGPLCDAFRSLASKYPFNPNATQEASPEELKSFFQPVTGTLWAYYEANYKNLLMRQGYNFIPSSPVRIPRDFLSFLNRSAIITDALFPPGTPSATPHLTFTLYQPVNNSIDKLNLEIQGKTLSGSGGNSQQFVWPGEGTQGVRLTVIHSGGSQFQFPVWPGQWAVFRFFQDAHRWTPKGSGYELEWPLEYNGRPVTRTDGTPIIVRYQLEGSAVQLFQKNFFQGLHCSTMGSR